MALKEVDDKNNQRDNHHLYVKEPIEKFFDEYLNLLAEKRRLQKCIMFVCKAHGEKIEDLYNNSEFRTIERIEGQTLRYGLLTILLRIGDLMDLEEGRTSKFNMSLNPQYYNSKISIDHNQHHLDDIVYDYNPNKINVNVLTDSREKYKIWSQWLEDLDKEVMYANTHYLLEENSGFFKNYKLPEIVKTVKPSDSANFAVEEIRFQVDDMGALWNIITKSVYTDEFDYVRELIQNAIDAILLKKYLNTKEVLLHESPRSWEIKERVVVAYSEKEQKFWIEDSGIGMSEHELSNYLFKIANSGYKYMEKRKFEFSAIAKFGIGFVACLTKANKIQILTCSKGENCIKAEIESNSAIAFLEKDIHRNCQGTKITLWVKEKYSFKELKNYICTKFVYPSVGIDLINADILQLYEKESILEQDNKSIFQSIEQIRKKRKKDRDEILPDYKCLQKMMLILLDTMDYEKVLYEIRNILSNIFYESPVMGKIRSIVENADTSEACISQIRKEVSEQKNILEEKLKRYPQFVFSITNNQINKIFDYKQLVLEVDDEFYASNIYKDTIVNKSSRGIIFIMTTFSDYDWGIEWCSVNAFMFNNGKIVKNILKVVSDIDEDFISQNIIMSFKEIEDAEYVLQNMLEEKDNEEYYENINNMWINEIETGHRFIYDALVVKNNKYYKLFDVEMESIEEKMKNQNFMQNYNFFDNIVIPSEYREQMEFGESKLYQDGISLEFDPQLIVPIGVGFVIANLTGKARFELNVSRHELSKNRESIIEWNKNIGSVIQEKVAQNCIQVLRENNLEIEIEDMLLGEAEDDFAKESLKSMKGILNKLVLEYK